MKRLCVSSLVLVMAMILAVQSAAAEKRVALVIGNGAYAKVGVLPNPPNDARLIGRTLRSVGFDVIEVIDTTQKQMKQAIKKFGNKLEAGGKDTVGLFYYAGHGIQVGSENYLIPVNAEINNEKDVDIESVSANTVLRSMEFAGNRVNIVIMDACRNNPYKRGFRSAARGLAKMEATSGTLIAYATALGDVAADGRGANSPYSKALAKAMSIPGITVERMFKTVRNTVATATDKAQIPWESSSLIGEDFYFSRPGNPPTLKVSGAPIRPVDKEAMFWNSIKDSTDGENFQAYLEQFPNGTFAPLAKLKVRKFGGQKIASVTPATTPKAKVKPQPTKRTSAALFSRALKLAENNEVRISSIARSMAETGKFDEAIKMISGLKRTDIRDDGLGNVIPVLTKIPDYARARALANMISEDSERAESLQKIASDQAANGDIAEALDTLNEVSGVGDVFYFTYVATNRARSGDIDGALSMIDQIPDADERSEARSRIARIQLEAGDREGGLRTLARSLGEADDIEEKSSRDKRRLNTASLLAEFGKTAEARALVEDLPQGDNQIWGEMFVSASGGDVDRVLQLANGIGNPSARDTAIALSGGILIRLKRWGPALKLLEKISNPGSRAHSLLGLARKIRENDNVLPVLDQAVSGARLISKILNRTVMLSAIGREYALWGEFEPARRTLQEAFDVAILPEPRLRSFRLLHVAESQMIAREFAAARHSIDERIIAAELDNKDYAKGLSSELADIAVLLHKIEKAEGSPLVKK